MNQLDPIEELYDMYLEEEKTPQITEVLDNRLRLDLDNKNRPADPFLEL